MQEKKLFDKLVEECTKSTDEVDIASENEHNNKCSSCALHVVLFSIIFTTSIGIAIYFIYPHWYLKKDDTRVTLDTRTETTNYRTYKWGKLKK